MTLGDWFVRSAGKPIEFDGQTVHMSHEWAVPEDAQGAEVAVVRASPRVRHGINLSARDMTLSINGHLMSKAIVWTDAAPSPFVVEFVPPRSPGALGDVARRRIRVWNSWDDGSGVTHAWVGNAGILIDPQPNKVVRLHCSDGGGEIDFESLVLDIKMF
ncbi:hypothetical protein [Kribbella sp. VKM Ac-2571]|uniref:hypothetical protein n=1 Tax=Kribbella sp. VKM Ac-2571 TaxID=2512222 RepID=UPI001060CDC3|nr:hypothetical protein [Kribbella sp. VKM Ac-2571]